MVWSWKGPGMTAPARLVFELETVAVGGTNLTLRLMDVTEEVASGLRDSGWPGNMTNLDTWVDMRL